MKAIYRNIITLLLLSVNLQGQIKIVSNVQTVKQDFIKSWDKNDKLTYEKTLWGETFYNPGWYKSKKGAVVMFEYSYKYFDVAPEIKRRWSFHLNIKNLHAEEGHIYFSTSARKKSLKYNEIFWGFNINFNVEGESESQTLEVLFVRGPEDGPQKFYLSVDGGSTWELKMFYPSCKIGTDDLIFNQLNVYVNPYDLYKSEISWSANTLAKIRDYIERINWIQITVGPQAKILVGKARAVFYEATPSTASDLIAQERYLEAKKQLYNPKNIYFEKSAVNLAICYLKLHEFDNCLNIATSLIEYNGDSQSLMYLIRGQAYEGKGLFSLALSDYEKAGIEGEKAYKNLNQQMLKKKQPN